MSSALPSDGDHWTAELAVSWRREAEVLEKRGADTQASVLRSCAEDLEARLMEWQTTELTLEEASIESGYSYSTLQQKVAAGKIPNSGVKGKPRVRRCHLPVGAQRVSNTSETEPDLATLVLSRRGTP